MTDLKPAERSYRWLFWTLALLGLAIDQGSKYWVFAALYGEGQGDEVVLIDEVFSLVAGYPNRYDPDPGQGFLRTLRTVSGDVMPHVNVGALWGQQLGLHGQTSNLIFAIVSLVAALGIIIWSMIPGNVRDGWLCFALGLILAGAVGNLYDRLVFRGVRDFLNFFWFEFPTFNIADSCLVCGAAVLLFQAFFMQPQQEKPKPETAPEAVASEVGSASPQA